MSVLPSPKFLQQISRDQYYATQQKFLTLEEQRALPHAVHQ